MALIHYEMTGTSGTPVVFVHGFACGHSDWAAQVAALSARYRVVTVDLRGHGLSPGPAEVCGVERYGADVADVPRALDLRGAVLVGHSMGCRVVVEAALQAPDYVAAVVLVDGSQFAPAMAGVLREQFSRADGYRALTARLFQDMFTARSDPAIAASVIARAADLPRSVGERMLSDLQRYDVTRWTASLACLRVPVLALQTTYSNENRDRETMKAGQNSQFLDMLRLAIPSVAIEIIPDTGHFPQLDEPSRTNAILERFIEGV